MSLAPASPYMFETILPSYGTITVCGTSGNYLHGGNPHRDTDSCEIVLTQEISLTWTCVAEFPLSQFLVDGYTTPVEETTWGSVKALYR